MFADANKTYATSAASTSLHHRLLEGSRPSGNKSGSSSASPPTSNTHDEFDHDAVTRPIMKWCTSSHSEMTVQGRKLNPRAAIRSNHPTLFPGTRTTRTQPLTANAATAGKTSRY